MITDRLDYYEKGNRRNSYRDRVNALVMLALGECMERKGRLLRDIANLLWSVCEVSMWVPPEHYPVEELPDITDNPEFIDLEAAETAATLAWVYYLLKEQLDGLSPMLCKRIEYEIDRRIIRPYISHPETMWWTGRDSTRRVTNWSVWITANVSACGLIMPIDSQTRYALLDSCCYTMEKYYQAIADDGGCDEGPGYWLAAGSVLFDFLEMLYSASNGKINLYDDEKLRQIGLYIEKVHISGRYFINICDANACMDVPAELIYRFGLRTGCQPLVNMGIGVMNTTDQTAYVFGNNLAGNLYRKLCYVFGQDKIPRQETAILPMKRDMQLPSLGLWAGSSERLYVCVNTGNNGVRHNHNDSGNFMVYLDGMPVVIDIGVGKYTRDSFNENRYHIWTMRSAYHNLPVIGGYEQCAGAQYTADQVDNCSEDDFSVKMHLEHAYPEEAGIRAYQRELTLLREKNTLICKEIFAMDQPVDIAFHMVSCIRPEMRGEGVLVFSKEGGSLHLAYPAGDVTVETEAYEIDDVRLQKSWDMVYRTIFRTRSMVKDKSFSFIFTVDK